MVTVSSSHGASGFLTARTLGDDLMSPSRRRRRASPEWAGRDIITVAALPGRGVYVRHLGHPEGVDGVHRPTVAPVGAPPPARPPAFDRHWLEANLQDFDVVHVHGLPARCGVEDVEEAIETVRSAGVPMVVTAYHLTDPHPPEGDEDGPSQFAEQLDALIPAADAVITLTAAGAEEIERRWSVQAGVLPHPHVVDFVRMRQNRASRRPGTLLVGAQLGSLRFPVDPVAVVDALMTAAARVPGTHVSVHVHEHLLDPDSSRYAAPTIRQIERIVSGGGGSLRAHRPLTDSQLWDHLFSLDASFVPPLPGSHSVWPEACYDLGTRVVMPASSLAAQQKPVPTYQLDRDGVPDVKSLVAALEAVAEEQEDWRADPTERWAERVQISEALRRLYEHLVPSAADTP
jgi:hypothetical protein